jgi:hypothetical protein
LKGNPHRRLLASGSAQGVIKALYKASNEAAKQQARDTVNSMSELIPPDDPTQNETPLSVSIALSDLKSLKEVLADEQLQSLGGGLFGGKPSEKGEQIKKLMVTAEKQVNEKLKVKGFDDSPERVTPT